MAATTEKQKQAYEEWHAASSLKRWEFHSTPDPLVRYLRDRRLIIATERVLKLSGLKPAECSVLVVCGGVGGEGTFFANLGFTDVTVTDISVEALKICEQRDPRLKTRQLDAEHMNLPDASYDVLIVQDGIHHMPRPVLGFTEALRVARRAVIVLEPHTGVVADLIGTKWEVHGEAENYVFRWNSEFFQQVTYSFLGRTNYLVEFIRLWDHSSLLGRVARLFGGGAKGLTAVKLAYGLLDTCFRFMGNSMVGLVIKEPVPAYAKPIGGKAKSFTMVNPEE